MKYIFLIITVFSIFLQAQNLEKVSPQFAEFLVAKEKEFDNRVDIVDDIKNGKAQFGVSDSSQKITKHVNVLLGFDKPPYIFAKASEKGQEADLVREIFKLVDYEVTILQGGKSEQEATLHNKNNIDAVATISEKNDGLFYSDTLSTYHNYVITRKDENIKIDSIEDLKNIKFVTWKNAYNDLGEVFNSLYNPYHGKHPNSYHDTTAQINDIKCFFLKK